MEFTQMICLPDWLAFLCVCGVIFGTAVVTWLWLALLRGIDLWHIYGWRILEHHRLRVVFCECLPNRIQREIIGRLRSYVKIWEEGDCYLANLVLCAFVEKDREDKSMLSVFLNESCRRFQVNLNNEEEINDLVEELLLFVFEQVKRRR